MIIHNDEDIKQKERDCYTQSQIKSLESEDSQISTLIREQYSQVREYDLIHEALINLANAGVFAREDLGENYNQFLEFRQQCINEVRGEEPVVEKIIHISFDGGETYENCLLCDLVADEIDWETAITKGLTIDGNAVSVADDNVIYCDRLLKYAKGDFVNKYDIIELDGWYVLER